MNLVIASSSCLTYPVLFWISGSFLVPTIAQGLATVKSPPYMLQLASTSLAEVPGQMAEPTELLGKVVQGHIRLRLSYGRKSRLSRQFKGGKRPV